ncbi:hypothetical protein KPH14_008231 [Odynerus spinipes]|uniref:Replication protein A 32 kDa subunit n=1 Tax=Odynerus spinipes TaxID=1348599 RepID=A0AAD9VML5_9HYME|nr:hypothetical protein KPH14_008231 [Odynerus spinipes]
MWENMDTSLSQAGGFLNESISQSGKSDGKKSRSREPNNIIPVMIGHIINSPKDSEDVFLGNLCIRIAEIMGVVRNVEQATTKTTYHIEDETGTITAVKWLEADKQSAESSVEVNVYVRVHGMIRNHNNVRHILVLSIEPIKDLNELTNHLLEVTYVSLKSKETSKAETKAENMSEVNMESSTYMNMDPDHLVIYNIILAENDSDCGIERGILKERVPPRLKASTDKILEFLISEGHIYTTRTDDHFKIT